jgi:hypothetical protein
VWEALARVPVHDRNAVDIQFLRDAQKRRCGKAKMRGCALRQYPCAD